MGRSYFFLQSDILLVDILYRGYVQWQEKVRRRNGYASMRRKSVPEETSLYDSKKVSVFIMICPKTVCPGLCEGTANVCVDSLLELWKCGGLF